MLHDANVAVHICAVYSISYSRLIHESDLVTSTNLIEQIPVRRCRHSEVKSSDFFKRVLRFTIIPLPPPRITGLSKSNKSCETEPSNRHVKANRLAIGIDFLNGCMNEANLR